MNDLYWCGEGCGFVDKDHRCEQWCHIYRIPGEARARICAEARAEAIEECIDYLADRDLIGHDGAWAQSIRSNLLNEPKEE